MNTAKDSRDNMLSPPLKKEIDWFSTIVPLTGVIILCSFFMIFPEQSACRHQAESKIYQLAVDKRLRRTGRVADYYHVFGIGSEGLIRPHRRYSDQKKRLFKKTLIL